MSEDWIRQSNLIEEVDDPVEDARCHQAWDWLLKQPWNLDTILLLHKRIMRKLNLRIAGKIRTCDVYVGNYKAPSWTLASGLLSEWVHRIAKKQRMQFIAWEDIKQDHIHFEGIHPFEDGNGRTGRMLMNWQRVKTGLEPLCIKASERWDYYQWFQDREK